MRIAVVAATTLLAAGAAQAFTPASKTLKDWTAVCDNTGACAAFGFAADTDDTRAFLEVTRSAGPAAAPAVEIGYDTGDTQPDQTWTLAIDGKAVPRVGTLAAKGGDDGARITLAPAQAAEVIDALRNGAHLQLISGGKSLADISLAGSAATLLWIDADQGRAGGVTAMVGKGPTPASAVPPPAAPPLVAAAAAPVSQAGLPAKAPPGLIKGNPDCDMDFNPAPEPDDIVARLGPGVVLWGPECDMAAYNEINVFYLGDEHGGHIRPLRLPDYTGFPVFKGATELVNAGFDPKTQTLSAFDKGRGLGDCGSSASWVWDGAAFQLVGETLMTECHGVISDDWPSLYRSTRK
jgi:hypothetical protein